MNEQYATAMQAQEAVGGMLVPGQQRRLDITLRQNIDQRIAEAQANVKTLEETKARMEKSGILDMRIDDIQRAMRW